jgi:hypothetical protein
MHPPLNLWPLSANASMADAWQELKLLAACIHRSAPERSGGGMNHFFLLLYFMRLAGIEPAPLASEASALSVEPQAQNLK